MVFATSDAADGWEELGRHAPGPTNECWQRLAHRSPSTWTDDNTLSKDKLSHRQVGDKRLPQWQYEVTGAGRLWYCPDLRPKNRMVD